MKRTDDSERFEDLQTSFQFLTISFTTYFECNFYFLFINVVASIFVDAFSSEIYCYGNLLHTVQMAQLFGDSKTFVDMKLKFSPEKTLADFEAFMSLKNNEPSKEEIRQFVNVSKFAATLIILNNHFIPICM